ncbi:MAG: ABC transporter substrate-binding protein [Hamadaea sp.]|nr:ABC transporter substrate-binding protein [Hamadaea sp.]
MTTLTRRSALVAALGAGIAAATAACSDSSSDDPAPQSSGNGSSDKVNYVTSFGTFGREAYAYVAKKKGFFTEAGLDVSIKPGNGSGDNIKLLAGGQADFVVVDFAALAIAVGKGQASGLVGISAVLQRSLAGVMTLEGYGISAPKDLEGKKIGDPSGSIIGTLFPTYAKLAGVDASKVQFVNLPAPNLPAALASKSVDAIGQFIVGKPTIEAAAGGKPTVSLSYSDFLTDLYGNTVLATEKMTKDKPDLIKRINGALIKGLKYAIDNPDEAGQILAGEVPTAKAATAAAELKIMASFVRGSSSVIGALEQDRVARALAILSGSGTIPTSLKPEQIVAFDMTPKA